MLAKCSGNINKKVPLEWGNFLFVLGNEFFVFGLCFVFIVVEWKTVAVFFDEYFDASGDWDGDDSANEAKHVNANSDGAEYDESWKLEAFALDFWRDEVGFNLEINDGVDEEGDAGREDIEGKEKGYEGAANEGAKHWDEAEDAGDETEWQSEAWREAEDDREEEDGNGSTASVDERNGDGAGDIFSNDIRHAFGDFGDTLGFWVGVEMFPKTFEDAWTFGKHEEGENENEDSSGSDIGDCADRGG